MGNILIVEDNRATAEQIDTFFTRAGHHCTVRASGVNILDIAKQHTPDVVVLDIMLPGTSGFEVCRRIRRDPELYTVPVLMLSAMNAEEEMLHGLAQGADDFVVKPFDFSNLRQRVEALIRANAAYQNVDELTDLPGGGGTKREIQRRISKGETFAVAHCEVPRLREYARKYGAEDRNRAIRHLARALSQCGAEVLEGKCFAGHMGGGHFIALFEPGKVKAFCHWVSRVWDKHVRKLFPGADDTEVNANRDVLALLLCATLRASRDSSTPQQVFEILSQLRHKALQSQQGGIYLDRRAVRQTGRPESGPSA